MRLLTIGSRRTRTNNRTDSSCLPWSSHKRYSGWGGQPNITAHRPVQRTPIVFVHGNKRDASDWNKHREHFQTLGYTMDELWAITFAQQTPTHNEMEVQLNHFLENVLEYTGSENVILVAHSLGVTGVRHCLHNSSLAESVAGFISIAGANHGTAYAKLCCRLRLTFGKYRVCPYLRSDYKFRHSHPLTELNENETSHDFPYYTIRGKYDDFFLDTESPKLDGAVENVLLTTDHDGVRESDTALEFIGNWIQDMTDQKYTNNTYVEPATSRIAPSN